MPSSFTCVHDFFLLSFACYMIYRSHSKLAQSKTRTHNERAQSCQTHQRTNT
jgi:hypothetical protein